MDEAIHNYLDEVVMEYFSSPGITVEEAVRNVMLRKQLDTRAKLTEDIRNIKGLEEYMRG